MPTIPWQPFRIRLSDLCVDQWAKRAFQSRGTGVSRCFCRLRCCIQVCQLCLVTCRHSNVSFISLFTLRECEAFRHAQAIVLLSPCKACYCGLSCFYKSVSFDSMTSLHWNLITRRYERVLPPPYRPTLPHPLRSTHSSFCERARLVLLTVTFVGFRTIKPAWLGGNAPIYFNKMTCDTSRGTCLPFHTCRCVAALIRPLTLEDFHQNAMGIGKKVSLNVYNSPDLK